MDYTYDFIHAFVANCTFAIAVMMKCVLSSLALSGFVENYAANGYRCTKSMIISYKILITIRTAAINA